MENEKKKLGLKGLVCLVAILIVVWGVISYLIFFRAPTTEYETPSGHWEGTRSYENETNWFNLTLTNVTYIGKITNFQFSNSVAISNTSILSKMCNGMILSYNQYQLLVFCESDGIIYYKAIGLTNKTGYAYSTPCHARYIYLGDIEVKQNGNLWTIKANIIIENHDSVYIED